MAKGDLTRADPRRGGTRTIPAGAGIDRLYGRESGTAIRRLRRARTRAEEIQAVVGARYVGRHTHRAVEMARLELERRRESTQKFVDRELGEVPTCPAF